MKVDRLVSILLILLERPRVNAQELANLFEVSLRTIYRDLDAIGQAGIPITSVPGVHGGFAILPQYKADRTSFSSSDLAALLLGLSSLPGFLQEGDPVHASAKLRHFIPPEQAEEIREQTARYRFNRSPWSGDVHCSESLELCRIALETHRLLSFDYITVRSSRSTRIVEPCQLVLKGQNWYLYAFCHWKQDYRLFRLTRMGNLSLKTETFSPRDFPPPQLDYAAEIQALQTEIQLRIQPAVLDRVLEFCTYDCLTPEDNSYLVRFPFVENDYYYDLLLSFGDKCECLGPEHVRRELITRIHRLAELYRRT